MVAITDEITTARAIVQAYERGHRGSGRDGTEEHRPHMGASVIGKDCERATWLTWRWARKATFEGRMLRLFDTGHMAEPRLVADLRATGATVHDVDPQTKKQFEVRAHNGHFGGSMDGVALGLVEAPKTWHTLEFKTHSEKSFTKLVKLGVKLAKPQHFDQMQVYMGLTGMTRSLYLAVNKNTDELHSERVEFDPSRYGLLLARAKRLIESAVPPARISDDPTWFECKMCDFAPTCHGTAAPEVNCRTCAHASPDLVGEDGAWRCGEPVELGGPPGNVVIPIAVQRTGCAGHRYIPALLEKAGKPVDFHKGDVVYEQADGRKWANGQQAGSVPSVEVFKAGATELLPDIGTVMLVCPSAKVAAAA